MDIIKEMIRNAQRWSRNAWNWLGNENEMIQYNKNNAIIANIINVNVIYEFMQVSYSVVLIVAS